jgi:ferredoxin
MKCHVNENCIGCALCTMTCPAVFTMGPDGKAIASETVPAGEEADARQALEGCPVGAIEEVDA